MLTKFPLRRRSFFPHWLLSEPAVTVFASVKMTSSSKLLVDKHIDEDRS